MSITRRSMIAGSMTFASLTTAGYLKTANAEKLKGNEKMNALQAIRNLDYTVLFARDMKAMRNFYANIMGFKLQRELSPQWVEYRVGSCILALTEHGLMFNDEKTPDGALSCMLAFRVTPEEVDGCAEELVAKGVSLISSPTNQPWGHRTAYFRDPDGNVLEIYADI